MGTGDQSSPAKTSKPASTNQETPAVPAVPSYADWSNSMQAYYGAGAPPFFASPVASPSPHPFMWGNQHPMMPPYGTPVPYPVYPPPGVYPHPSMAMAPAPLQATAAEPVAKTPEVKEGTSNKKTKGASRAVESGKVTSGSGNDGATQSAESGSDGSSDGSDDDNNHEQSASKKGSFNLMLAEATAQNNNAVVPGNPVVAVPPSNLNIGMELWNSSSAPASGSMKRSTPGVAVAPGMMGDQWVQDEREMKRQKRKQSNRESARRSRMRKQAECEELQHRVEALNDENRGLRDELQKLRDECGKLTSENNTLKEELVQMCGAEAVSNLENKNAAQAAESNNS